MQRIHPEIDRGRNPDIEGKESADQRPQRIGRSGLRHTQQPDERKPAQYQEQLPDCDSCEISLIVALDRPEQCDASGPHSSVIAGWTDDYTIALLRLYFESLVGVPAPVIKFD